MLKARAAARCVELGRAMLALALTGARAAGASGLYAEVCVAGPAQGCSSPSTLGCCATHSSQLRLHWPSSNSVGARPGRRQGHLLREERWRDVWGGLGGSPYRNWRFSFLCEAGVGAGGRFKTGQIVDVNAEGIDVYNTLLATMDVKTRLGPDNRDAKEIDLIRR